MANIIRSAKSSGDWCSNELMAYNIIVTAIAPEHFIPKVDLPAMRGLDLELVSASLDADGVSDDTYRFLTYLHMATNTGQETAIDDFAREVLRTIGFEERGLVLRTQHTIPLTICGDNKVAQIDVCLLDRQSTILLVVQNDKTNFNPSLDLMEIPCITMIGTRPIFYLVPVTKALSDAVITGQWAPVPTRVLKCVTVAGHNRRAREGMETPEYRKVALERFVAFNAVAKSHWKKFQIAQV
ncbi:hypothetical protein PILCRDRAFT_823276 [Piloderma croceum F 1598]|uniref:Uncharacterized protein n=1 Tax=Piloderma croceum (strain F 1598) TaxID=765440 RepID=A0A0C3BR00_PILCF|nr:hypothetical protein PILCRDRAFT_823276 [Piloderma croceum F 1598]